MEEAIEAGVEIKSKNKISLIYEGMMALAAIVGILLQCEVKTEKTRKSAERSLCIHE